MSTERGLLAEIADSIADQTPVDWDGAEAATSDRGKLRWLRVVEAISLAHREPRDETPGLASASAPPEHDLPRHWGPLVLVEPLGGGSLGAVYRAHDTRLGCDVALKLLKSERSTPEAEERFIDEARQLARVRHPNVLVVHGADRHDGRVGLWTDLLEGRTLEEGLRADGPLCADEAARIGIDLCHALAAVHGAGLVHRDVKTSNVMRERGGRIVLLDFSSVAERETAEGLSRPAGTSGTPLFMAPELFRGADADARTDLYSLGVLLYRLVTESYPVEAASFDELVAKHERGEMRPLLDARADLPQPFVRVVERALERDPTRRWASPGEMERALGTLVAPQPVPDERRRPVSAPIATLAAVAGVAAIALAVWWFIPRPLELDTQWSRSSENGREERLFQGARVAAGDRLFLEIEPTRRAYVWVLSQDSRGEPCVLFPLEELDQGNPLSGGRRHRLPGTAGGTAMTWEVANGGGTETFLVVASTSLLPELERRIEGLTRTGQYGSPEPSRPTTTRGIAGLVPDAGVRGATPGLAAIRAEIEAQFGGKVRIVKIDFDNPGP